MIQAYSFSLFQGKGFAAIVENSATLCQALGIELIRRLMDTTYPSPGGFM
jgi:hypothetical protein